MQRIHDHPGRIARPARICNKACRDHGSHDQRRWMNARLFIVSILVWITASAVPGAAESPVNGDNRTLLKCAAIMSDQQRLRCFDTIVRQTRTDRFQPVAIEPRDAAATPPPATSRAPRVRVAAGYGFGIGDHTGSFRVLSGHLDLNSAAGGSGALVSGQIWIDRWIAEEWTIGLEYVAVRNEGRLSAAFPQGVSIVNGSATAGARVKIGADMAFVNLAWRRASGSVRPARTPSVTRRSK